MLIVAHSSPQELPHPCTLLLGGRAVGYFWAQDHAEVTQTEWWRRLCVASSATDPGDGQDGGTGWRVGLAAWHTPTHPLDQPCSVLFPDTGRARQLAWASSIQKKFRLRDNACTLL
jgi:hypothetical protein